MCCCCLRGTSYEDKLVRCSTACDRFIQQFAPAISIIALVFGLATTVIAWDYWLYMGRTLTRDNGEAQLEVVVCIELGVLWVLQLGIFFHYFLKIYSKAMNLAVHEPLTAQSATVAAEEHLGSNVIELQKQRRAAAEDECPADPSDPEN